MGKKAQKSFSRKISWSFLGMGGITLSLVVLTLYQTATMAGLGIRSTRIFQPSQLHLANTLAGLEQTSAFSQVYSHLSTKDREAYSSIWKKHINPSLDSLKATMPKLEAADQILIGKVIDEIGQYRSLSEKHLKHELDGNLGKTKALLQSIRENINSAIELIHSHRKRDLAEFYNHFDLFKFIELVAICLAGLLGYLLFRGLRKKIRLSVRDIQLAMEVFGKGNLPASIPPRGDELDEVRQEIDQLSRNLGHIRKFALDVGEGKYGTDIQVFSNNGEIGSSLGEMRDRLKSIAEEREIRQWHNEGLAMFSELLSQHSDSLQGMAEAIMSRVVPYVQASLGGLYVVTEEQGSETMRLTGSYARDCQHALKESFMEKEGLLGQAWHLRKPLYFSKLPKNYVQIQSGLGASDPSSLFIFPLISNDELFGIMELASFQTFNEAHREFLLQLSQLIASAILSVRSSANTKKLLQEAQCMTQQMQAQEEEMRQNMEELNATQDEIERKSRQDQAFINALDRGLAMMSLDSQLTILDVNSKFEKIAGVSRNALLGQSAKMFLTSDTHKSKTPDELWRYVEKNGIFERIDERMNARKEIVTLQIKYLGVYGSGKRLEKILCLINEIQTQNSEL